MKNKHDYKSITFLISNNLGSHQNYGSAKRGIRLLLRFYAKKPFNTKYYFKHIKQFPFIIGEYTNGK